MNPGPTRLQPDAPPQRDPLAAIAVPLAPIALEGRYRVLVGALWRLRRSQKGRWALAVGSGAVVVALALLAARHFATASWPLANGSPGVLAAAGCSCSSHRSYRRTAGGGCSYWRSGQGYSRSPPATAVLR